MSKEVGLFSSLSGKMIFSFSLVVAMTLSQGLISVWLLNSSNLDAEKEAVKIEELQSLRTEIDSVRLRVFENLGTENPAQMDKLQEQVVSELAALADRPAWPEGAKTIFLASSSTYKEILNLHHDFQAKKAYALIADRSQKEHKELSELIGAKVSELQKSSHTRASERRLSAIRLNAGICVLAALFAAIIAKMLSKSIVGAINDTRRVLESGDFSRMQQSTRRDEIGDLTRAVGAMSEQLRSTINGIRQRSTALSDAAKGVAEIARNSNDVVEQERRGTTQVASAIGSMLDAIQRVASNAHSAADAAGAAGKNSNQGKRVVQDNLQALRELTESMEKASTVIQELEKESSNIGQVLNVIRGVAEQTNLLALNAAIEAARAGEQGRGFAVVADEVRTLASRTQQSTLEINEMIARLQNGTDQAVKVMLGSRDQARWGLEHAERGGQALDSIEASVAEITEMNRQIAAAVQAQIAAAEEVKRNISNIEHLSDQAAEGAAKTASQGDYMAKLAREMQELVAQFKV